MKKILIATLLIMMTGGSFLFSSSVYSRTVLGLYNSEQNQTAKENEINFYVVNVLREMGLQVRFHDIARGIPENTDDFRAVISWFRGGTMKEPEAYLKFMRDVVTSGKKFVVLGNFGAFGNSESGTYLPKEQLNTALSLLGLRYAYEWTDKSDLLRIETIDRTMTEQGGRQDVDISRFYYRFIPADRQLKIYLSLSRTDKDHDESPVIVSNRNGGFALGSYIYHYIDGKVTMLLDMEKFLVEALFPPPYSEKIVLLADPADEACRRTLENTKIILDRSRMDYEVIERSQFADLVPQDLYSFTMAGMILPDDSGLTADFFDPFLERGGGIVSLYSGNFSSLNPLLGLSGTRQPRKTVKGYRFPPGFTLGEGLSLANEEYQWRQGPFPPEEAKTTTIASDSTHMTPLLWSLQRKKGKVLVWNWEAFQDKTFRGLIIESFLSLRPVGISGIPGIATMFLDDWPLPMYNTVKKPLTGTDTDFFTKTWWPDIKTLFDRYDIPFSSYLIFEYNSVNKPPYVIEEFFIGRGQPSTEIAREIIASRHELAFHGYNHRSLLLDDRTPELGYWPDKQSMKKALETAREEWIRLFGDHNLPTAYVAPHNLICEEGVEAVVEVFPSIKVISTVISSMSRETVTEFGCDPDIDGLYNFPRTTSGYILDTAQKAYITSGIMGYGVWAHFIHADDIFDPARSRGLQWPALKKGLQDTLAFVHRHYPWLEFVTATEAGRILRTYDSRNMETSWDSEGKKLTVIAPPGFQFRVKVNEGFSVTQAEGAKILYRYKDDRNLILEATLGKTTIFLGGED